MTTSDCLFCKISRGDVPADIVFENDSVVAFKDINPKAPTHILIIPRRHLSTINDIGWDAAADVGALFVAAATIASDLGFADDGYRAVMNCNEAAGQTVFHIHLHLLAGRPLSWPPG